MLPDTFRGEISSGIFYPYVHAAIAGTIHLQGKLARFIEL